MFGLPAVMQKFSSWNFFQKLYFRQSWKDDRLAFSNVPHIVGSDKSVDPDQTFNVDASIAEHLWRPDVLFNEGRTASRHYVSTKNLALDIQVKFYCREF